MSSHEEGHRLHTQWCLWHTPQIGSDDTTKYGSFDKAQSALTKNIQVISTVEEFWGTYNAIPPSTQLPKDEVIMFFRSGIEPQWEDSALKNGGRVIVRINISTNADCFIRTLLTHTLGEQMSIDLGVTGVIAGVRYQRKESKKDAFIQVQVWITDQGKSQEVEARICDIAEECKIDNLRAYKENLVFKPF